jgi:hypothetical protein
VVNPGEQHSDFYHKLGDPSQLSHIESSYSQILAHEAAFRASLVAQSIKNDLIMSRQNIKQNGVKSSILLNA